MAASVGFKQEKFKEGGGLVRFVDEIADAAVGEEHAHTQD